MQKVTDEWINSNYKEGCYIMMEKNISIKIARDCGLQCVALYNFIFMHKYSNNPHGCYPSYETIMKECSISSKATLLSYLNKLEDNGYIKIKSGNRSGANLYYFPLMSNSISNYTEDDHKYIESIQRKKGTKNEPSEKSLENLINYNYYDGNDTKNEESPF